MSEAFCPELFWNYKYCNDTIINEKALTGFKIKGKLTEELENLYSTYLKSAIHPSLLKVIKKLDEEEEIEKEKQNNQIQNQNQNIIQKKEPERKHINSITKKIEKEENKSILNVNKEDEESNEEEE